MIGALEMGGSQALVMNLYRHIDREKIQFDFILDHPDRDDYVDEVKALGGRIYTMPGFHGNVHQVRRAWDEFFTNHPEYKVLHSHVRSYASLYLPIAKRHGVKTIIHSHSTSNGKGFSSLVKMALQYPLRYQADVLMGCSKESGEWLFGKKATAGDRFFFLPNGVDLQRFSFDENIRQQYRRDMGLEDKIVIGHVGRFHPAKNHMFLLESFAQLKRLRPNAVLPAGSNRQRYVNRQPQRCGRAYAGYGHFGFPIRLGGLTHHRGGGSGHRPAMYNFRQNNRGRGLVPAGSAP
jgi:glycosyltransferase involved in cell wall biosynthesis